ncbi:MAG: hypothetical protein H6670_14265 [Anaerolineaceae bacterium]|nr:hypothetical protein [Anaerolineaceae bacterium]
MRMKPKQQSMTIKGKVVIVIFAIVIALIGPYICFLLVGGAYEIYMGLSGYLSLHSIQAAIQEQCPSLEIEVDISYYDWDPFGSYWSQEVHCSKNPYAAESGWKCSCQTPIPEPQGANQ